jgi:sugar phosphate isomerase/epimerase
LTLRGCANEDGADFEVKAGSRMNKLTRRAFLLTSGAAGAALALDGLAPEVAPAAGASKRALGIELYSVNADLAKDLSGTLAALATIGYKLVETGVISTIPAKDLKKGLDATGLACVSCHFMFATDDPQKQLEETHAAGAQYAVSSLLAAEAAAPSTGPAMASVMTFINAIPNLTVDDYKKMTERANRIGAKAKEAGLQFAYHNHNFEFRDLGAGTTGYDVLLKETDAELVKFELDCGWMVAAGHNPLDYFAKYKKRFRMIHVKDFQAGAKPTTALIAPDNPKGTELGKGFIDYKPIFAAAGKAGVEYYFSEQEPPIVGMTALEAAKVNYEYMRGI